MLAWFGSSLQQFDMHKLGPRYFEHKVKERKNITLNMSLNLLNTSAVMVSRRNWTIYMKEIYDPFES